MLRVLRNQQRYLPTTSANVAVSSARPATLAVLSSTASWSSTSSRSSSGGSGGSEGGGIPRPWEEEMPESQFDLMRNVLAAPSPIGLESAMTSNVILPHFDSFAPPEWHVHRFKGQAGVVVDSAPGCTDKTSVMIIGHCDKIRMQVKSVGADGKVWIGTDSFLPLTLLGNEVAVFSEDASNPGNYRVIKGATVEALGAIHFAPANVRSGAAGVKAEQMYLEFGVSGKKRKEQVESLGIRPGDSILLDRPIKRGVAPRSFMGAYLDNGLGCFVTSEVARLVAEAGGLNNIRMLFTFASYEEIGRFGSRVMASVLNPDIILATDVNHDYVAAPGVGDKHYPPLSMGEGFTLTTGSIASEYINSLIQKVALKHDIPLQRDMSGVDTGTDAMAGVLGGVDAAATSIGFPIRNMHTISETGHTGDVLAAIHGIYHSLVEMDGMNGGSGLSREDLQNGHPRLDTAGDPPVMSAGEDDESDAIE